MAWQDWVPGLGTKTTRERVDEVFSRDVLGSVFVSTAAGKMVETLVKLAFPGLGPRFFGWAVTFVLAIYLFAYWESVVEAASEATNNAKEKAAEKVDSGESD